MILLLFRSTLPEYDPVPPPDSVPDGVPLPVLIGNVSLSAEGEFYAFDPHQGPVQFSFVLTIKLINSGNYSVSNVSAVRTTIYSEEMQAVFTCGLVPKVNMILEPLGSNSLEFQNDRYLYDPPINIFSDRLFARVFVTVGSQDAILTTSLYTIWTAIE